MTAQMYANETAHERSERLLRQEIERNAYEAAAKAIEGLSGTAAYEQAWRKAARAVRELKA